MIPCLKQFIGIILLFSFIFVSNAQSSDINVGCAPIKIKFTPPAGYNKWYWDFKDGVSSSLQFPEHIFTTPGKYIVEYREVAGGVVIGSILITIHPKPDININVVPVKGCLPLNVNFEDLTYYPPDMNVLDRSWIFGDGEFNTGNPVPHKYLKPGIFEVALEVKTNITGCDHIKNFKDIVEVLDKPKVEIFSDPTPAVSCYLPLQVKYSSTSSGALPLTYFWSFGNGGSSLKSQPGLQSFYEYGNYPVTLHVLDKYGCVNSDTIETLARNFLINIQYPDTVCINHEITFNNLSEEAYYTWGFPPDASILSSNEKDPKVSFSTPGLKEVYFTAGTNEGKCVVYKTLKVYVFDTKDAFHVTYDTNDCKLPIIFNFSYDGEIGENDIIEWTFNKVLGSDKPNPVYTYIPDKNNYSIYGLRSFPVNVSINSAGCSVNKNFKFPISIISSCFKTDVYKGCAPLTLKFMDCSYSKQSIIKWTWIFGDGESLVSTNPTPPEHIYKECGIYNPYLIIENEFGCIDTSYSIPITVCGDKCISDYPELITPKQTICRGTSVDFKISANSFWKDIRIMSDNGRLFHCSDEREFSWIFNHEPGNHDVELIAVSVNGDIYKKLYKDHITVLGPWAQGHYMLVNCKFPREYLFTDNSVNTNGWTWRTPSSTLYDKKEFTYQFNEKDKKEVLLIANSQDFACPDDTMVFSITSAKLESKIKVTQTNCNEEIDFSLDSLLYVSCHDGIKISFDNNVPPITTQESGFVYKFKNTGTYKIKMEASDQSGCPVIDSTTIKVRKLVAKIKDLPSKICLPFKLELIDESVSEPDAIIKYKWYINDLFVSAKKNGSNYDLSKAYLKDKVTIRLVVETETCTAEIVKDIEIVRIPSSIYVLGDWVYCPNEIIELEGAEYEAGGSYLDYVWDFGNGDSATTKFANTSYAIPGTHKIKLNYTEHSTGCSGSTSVNITVQDFPDPAFITNIDNEEVHCYPKNVYFIPQDTMQGNEYSWDFGNGGGSNFKTPATFYNKGTYKVSLIVKSSQGCTAVFDKTLDFVGPSGDIAFDKTAICKGDALIISLKDTSDVGNWIWDLGDGNVTNGINPISHTYSGGSTIVKLVLSDIEENCTYIVEKDLPVILIKADFDIFGSIDTVCIGDQSLNNKSKNASSYLWKFEDGSTSTEINPPISFVTKGSQKIILIAKDSIAGCTDSITRYLHIRDFIINENLTDVTICPGDSVKIGLSSQLDKTLYQWYPSDNLLDPKSFSTLAFPNATTNYNLNVEQVGGCKVNKYVKVTLLSPYNGESTLNHLTGKGSLINLIVPVDINAYTFTWNPASILNCSKCPSPAYYADSNTTFLLTIVDTLGCQSFDIIYNVKIVPDEIVLPNVFTPNGDNKNDYFQFFIPGGNLEDINLLSFKVFDRWGQLVYNNSNPELGWDGTYNGSPGLSDVYVYLLEVSFQTGKTLTYKGEITLVR